jgi:methionyl-tRNA formyltransferase
MKTPLKIVFAGTPEFAATILDAIQDSEHQLVCVLTQPDRPSGRGLKVLPGPVKQRAIAMGVDILQPHSLKLDGIFSEQAQSVKTYLENLQFDIMVVAAYGLILPQWLLTLVEKRNPLGCINVHASLLPRWRGAAPIHRAIWAGDQETGTCIMKMAIGLDTGPIITQETMTIQSLDTTETLHDRLAAQGARLLLEVLGKLEDFAKKPLLEQSEVGITYAEKIKKEEAKIDWNQTAGVVDRQIRALNPTPGASTSLDEEIYKIWLSEDISHQWKKTSNLLPGQIIEMSDIGISVQTGDGVIRLLEIQKAGAKRMSAAQFYKANQIKLGQVFK